MSTENEDGLALNPPDEGDNDSNRLQCACADVPHSAMAFIKRFGIRRILTIAIFFSINFCNYVDRYICASILVDLQKQFDIGDNLSGLLQTCFFASYMLAAPVFGYLGDRRSRIRLMTVGLVFWAVISGCAAAVPTNLFGVFLLLRALIGVGEASYATLCPTVISDIFTGSTRTMVLLMYSVAVPLGCGTSYILAPAVSTAFGSWRFAFVPVPIAVLILSLLLMLVVREPIRGQADGLSDLKPTSLKEDLFYLMHVKSFILVVLGFVGLAFCLGAITFWCPIFFDRAYLLAGKGNSTISKNTITYIFGGITVGAGIAGVTIGTFSAYVLRRRLGDTVDAAICGWGLLFAAPCMYVILLTIISNPLAAWSLVFVTVLFLSMNWVLVIDIIMYSVVPTRRATAASVQMFAGHLLGDAASPYIIGGLSSMFAPSDGWTNPIFSDFIGLQSALYTMPFVLCVGSVAFLLCSLFCAEDHRRAAQGYLGNNTDPAAPHHVINNNGIEIDASSLPTD